MRIFICTLGDNMTITKCWQWRSPYKQHGYMNDYLKKKKKLNNKIHLLLVLDYVEYLQYKSLCKLLLKKQ